MHKSSPPLTKKSTHKLKNKNVKKIQKSTTKVKVHTTRSKRTFRTTPHQLSTSTTPPSPTTTSPTSPTTTSTTSTTTPPPTPTSSSPSDSLSSQPIDSLQQLLNDIASLKIQSNLYDVPHIPNQPPKPYETIDPIYDDRTASISPIRPFSKFPLNTEIEAKPQHTDSLNTDDFLYIAHSQDPLQSLNPSQDEFQTLWSKLTPTEQDELKRASREHAQHFLRRIQQHTIVHSTPLNANPTQATLIHPPLTHHRLQSLQNCLSSFKTAQLTTATDLQYAQSITLDHQLHLLDSRNYPATGITNYLKRTYSKRIADTNIQSVFNSLKYQILMDLVNLQVFSIRELTPAERGIMYKYKMNNLHDLRGLPPDLIQDPNIIQITAKMNQERFADVAHTIQDDNTSNTEGNFFTRLFGTKDKQNTPTYINIFGPHLPPTTIDKLRHHKDYDFDLSLPYFHYPEGDQFGITDCILPSIIHPELFTAAEASGDVYVPQAPDYSQNVIPSIEREENRCALHDAGFQESFWDPKRATVDVDKEPALAKAIVREYMDRHARPLPLYTNPILNRNYQTQRDAMIKRATAPPKPKRLDENGEEYHPVVMEYLESRDELVKQKNKIPIHFFEIEIVKLLYAKQLIPPEFFDTHTIEINTLSPIINNIHLYSYDWLEYETSARQLSIARDVIKKNKTLSDEQRQKYTSELDEREKQLEREYGIATDNIFTDVGNSLLKLRIPWNTNSLAAMERVAEESQLRVNNKDLKLDKKDLPPTMFDPVAALNYIRTNLRSFQPIDTNHELLKHVPGTTAREKAKVLQNQINQLTQKSKLDPKVNQDPTLQPSPYSTHLEDRIRYFNLAKTSTDVPKQYIDYFENSYSQLSNPFEVHLQGVKSDTFTTAFTYIYRQLQSLGQMTISPSLSFPHQLGPINVIQTLNAPSESTIEYLTAQQMASNALKRQFGFQSDFSPISQFEIPSQIIPTPNKKSNNNNNNNNNTNENDQDTKTSKSIYLLPTVNGLFPHNHALAAAPKCPGILKPSHVVQYGTQVDSTTNTTNDDEDDDTITATTTTQTDSKQGKKLKFNSSLVREKVLSTSHFVQPLTIDSMLQLATRPLGSNAIITEELQNQSDSSQDEGTTTPLKPTPSKSSNTQFIPLTPEIKRVQVVSNLINYNKHKKYLLPPSTARKKFPMVHLSIELATKPSLYQMKSLQMIRESIANHVLFQADIFEHFAKVNPDLFNIIIDPTIDTFTSGQQSIEANMLIYNMAQQSLFNRHFNLLPTIEPGVQTLYSVLNGPDALLPLINPQTGLIMDEMVFTPQIPSLLASIDDVGQVGKDLNPGVITNGINPMTQKPWVGTRSKPNFAFLNHLLISNPFHVNLLASTPQQWESDRIHFLSRFVDGNETMNRFVTQQFLKHHALSLPEEKRPTKEDFVKLVAHVHQSEDVPQLELRATLTRLAVPHFGEMALHHQTLDKHIVDRYTKEHDEATGKKTNIGGDDDDFNTGTNTNDDVKQ